MKTKRQGFHLNEKNLSRKILPLYLDIYKLLPLNLPQDNSNPNEAYTLTYTFRDLAKELGLTPRVATQRLRALQSIYIVDIKDIPGIPHKKRIELKRGRSGVKQWINNPKDIPDSVFKSGKHQAQNFGKCFSSAYNRLKSSIYYINKKTKPPPRVSLICNCQKKKDRPSRFVGFEEPDKSCDIWKQSIEYVSLRQEAKEIDIHTNKEGYVFKVWKYFTGEGVKSRLGKEISRLRQMIARAKNLIEARRLEVDRAKYRDKQKRMLQRKVKIIQDEFERLKKNKKLYKTYKTYKTYAQQQFNLNLGGHQFAEIMRDGYVRANIMDKLSLNRFQVEYATMRMELSELVY